MASTTYTISEPKWTVWLKRLNFRSPVIYGMIIIAALLAFEMFNYSTTDYALSDLLGNLKFAGIPWSVILAVAFCGIDFAGIARLFTPETGNEEPKTVWYLFGAWMLAAVMNAILTWWGVAMAISNHQVRSTAVIDPVLVTKVVPVFVAVMVWVIRVLIIGSLSSMGDRLFQQGSTRSVNTAYRPTGSRPINPSNTQRDTRYTHNDDAEQSNSSRPAYGEPTYQSLNPRPVAAAGGNKPYSRMG